MRLRESRTEGERGGERAIKRESAIKRDQKKERGEGVEREREPVTEIAWSKLAHHLPRMFTFEFTYLSPPEICVVVDFFLQASRSTVRSRLLAKLALYLPWMTTIDFCHPVACIPLNLTVLKCAVLVFLFVASGFVAESAYKF